MSKAWQFWPGHGRNMINPQADRYNKVVEEYRQEEIELAAHEEVLKARGEEIEKECGFKFLGVSRRHESGVGVSKNPKLRWMIPPKRIFLLGFEIASAGSKGWKVRDVLADWAKPRLSGKLSYGWNIWLNESELCLLKDVFRKPPEAEFKAWHRRGGASHQGDGWVIRPDGNLRQPDHEEVPRFKTDGTYIWFAIAPDELALQWRNGHRSEGSVSGKFEVVKSPLTITPEQLAAVSAIEAEIGVPENVFGFSSKAAERERVYMDEFIAACPVCPVCRETIVYDSGMVRRLLAGKGVFVCEDGGVEAFVDWNKPFDQRASNRDAQIAGSVKTPNGRLEFLAYEKFGHWNLDLRFCEGQQDGLVEQPAGDWQQLDKKWWRCPRGHASKVGKNATEVVCGICGQSHKA